MVTCSEYKVHWVLKISIFPNGGPKKKKKHLNKFYIGYMLKWYLTRFELNTLLKFRPIIGYKVNL